ncbi:MAG: DUF4242 domain-containing protein [Saprospiraceae bacterium]|nr:DUF4242 domain-containing protein [Saprospiraceae bacterium]MCB0544996.1 DUF4242 domain-containing protein [Saprospiraceae bacterium]MCB0575062.1 DUF4242 domain-containing protein [Saprospiraceae bacterium]MCB9306129.1 DUF4242 domain-containing protein [Lewinellaceae bacterium]
MKKFVIERELPGAKQLTQAQLQEIAINSCAAIDKLDAQYHWVQTFVVEDRLYCVHMAPDEATIRLHAKEGGFPVTRVSEVLAIIDPTTSV